MHWKLNFFNVGPVLAIENYSSKSPVRLYTNCTGQIWYVHWFPSWKVSFGPNSIAVQSWEVCELEFDFFDCGSLFIELWRFFKVTCAAVQELYMSNLVCTLILILKGVFWSKQHSCTVLGSMCTENWIFFNGDPVLAIENSSKSPVRPYTNCTGQIWYVHWFPSWKVSFGPNRIAVQSWEVC